MSEAQEYTVEIGISFANDDVLSVGDVVTLDKIPADAQSDIPWLLQQNYLVPVVPVHEVDLAAAEVRVTDPPVTDPPADPPVDPPTEPVSAVDGSTDPATVSA